MAPKLYLSGSIVPVRPVLLTEKALGLTLEHVQVDLEKGEHLTEEFLKRNPQHTVPVLEDDGYVLWDSHAIIAYLASKYGKEEDTFCPNDPAIRGKIDQRLHFETGVALETLRTTVDSLLESGAKHLNDEQKDVIDKVYGFMESFLNESAWVASENVTIADFSLIPTITSLNVLEPIAKEKYPKLTAWIEKAKEWPYYDANAEGLKTFEEFVEKLDCTCTQN